MASAYRPAAPALAEDGEFAVRRPCHLAHDAGDKRYGYVTPPTLAPHGTRAPLAGLLVLQRQEGQDARLERLDPAETVHHLLRQSIGPAGDTSVLARLGGLGEQVPGFLLTYADLEDAVALIRNTLGRESIAGAAAAPPRAVRAGRADNTNAAAADLRLTWARHPSVAVRRSGTSTLLWHSDHATTFHLNAVAAAIWTLLAEAQTGEDIVAILGEAFPDQAEENLRRDLAGLFAGLAEEELIVST